MSSIIIYVDYNNTYGDVPYTEEHNSRIAWLWYEQTYGIYPSSEMSACVMIDEFRNVNNLTYEDYPCIVWTSDMSDWYYY